MRISPFFQEENLALTHSLRTIFEKKHPTSEILFSLILLVIIIKMLDYLFKVQTLHKITIILNILSIMECNLCNEIKETEKKLDLT